MLPLLKSQSSRAYRVQEAQVVGGMRVRGDPNALDDCIGPFLDCK